MAYVQDSFLTNDILHEMVRRSRGRAGPSPGPAGALLLGELGSGPPTPSSLQVERQRTFQGTDAVLLRAGREPRSHRGWQVL